MDYHFDRHKPYGDPLFFALCLDRQIMKERILIGSGINIIQKLRSSEAAELYCDVTRPLGALLYLFKRDDKNEWSDNGLIPLYSALHTNRWKQPALEQKAALFIEDKYATGDPVSMYAAIRLWNGYLRAREPRDRNTAAELFYADIRRLLSFFSDTQPENLLRIRDNAGFDTGMRYVSENRLIKLSLLYPTGKPDLECISEYSSFLPVVIYYLYRLSEWGFVFRQCRICKKPFLATSLKFEICSNRCRTKAQRQSKSDFDERGKKNTYDRLYKNTCQLWRNRIHAAEKKPDFPQVRLDQIKYAYETFRKEALSRKNDLKSAKKRDKAEFLRQYTDWLNEQVKTADSLYYGS